MFFSTINKIGALVLSGILLFQPLIIPTTAINNNVGNDNTNDLIPPNCGNHWQSSYVVNSNEDLDKLSGCQSLNGSLYINGGDNINSLLSLYKLHTIYGHLVILDSPLLTTLEGLHNIHNIYAYEKYLDTYSVSIKHNYDAIKPSHGLCFVNTFPWFVISQNQNVEIKNNAINCSKCHSQCHNCWDKYSYTCFRCKKYKSGNHCIEHCPIGTSIQTEGDYYNNIICKETIPGEPYLNFVSKTYNSTTFNINIPNPNGVINNINVTINNKSETIYTYLDDIIIPNNYTFIDLSPFTEYQFNIMIQNSEGNTSSQNNYLVKTYPYIPFKPNTLIPSLDEDNYIITFQIKDDINKYILENNIEKLQIIYHLLNIDTNTGKEIGIINTKIKDVVNNDFTLKILNLLPCGNYSFQLKVTSGYDTWNISDISETIYLKDDNNNDIPNNIKYPSSFIIMSVVIAVVIFVLFFIAVLVKSGKINKQCITDNIYIAAISCATCLNYISRLTRCFCLKKCKCKKRNNIQLPQDPIYEVPNNPITIVPGSTVPIEVNMFKNPYYIHVEAFNNNNSSLNNPYYGQLRGIN